MVRKVNAATRAEDVFTIYGSFGYVNGPLKGDDHHFTAEGQEYLVSVERVMDEQGVVSQKGKIKNIADHPITVNCMMAKFAFDGGEYEVYTQSNTWMNESVGRWQPLLTSVSAETRGLRDSYGAAPFGVLWSKQTECGVAFHIIAQFSWKLMMSNMPLGGQFNYIAVEAGLNNCNLNVTLRPGEELDMPEIIYYEVKNRTDLDCYKLHNYIHQTYPRREMPVIFNTWLYRFERIDFDNVAAQIPRAKELGVEYFVIDAGWFGQGNFWLCRGDWYENTEDAFRGRMRELSDLVRANGMKFGFWLEVETAGADARILETQGDLHFKYGSSYFLDFANPKACEYMLQTVSGLVEQYDAKFIKFDFNQDLPVDVGQDAFVTYFKGYRHFIRTLKKMHPDLYVENCASGGMRMSLAGCVDFDSFWLSDNQSPYEGMRIFKDTILRLPPQVIEKWATIQSASRFVPAYEKEYDEKIISTNDAIWNDVRGVHQSFLEGFLTGTPIGFSCDLNSFSLKLFEGLKKFVAGFKKDREFWQKAVCRILTDTESMLVLEFCDMSFEKAVVVVFSLNTVQNNIRVYPVIDENARYRISGQCFFDGENCEREVEETRKEQAGALQQSPVPGSRITACGIDVPVHMNFEMMRFTLDKADKSYGRTTEK